jgi:hypothetical protein
MRMAGKPYGNLGHRRLPVIARSTAEAQAWVDVQGVTHISDQHGDGAYREVTPPPVAFHPLTDRPKVFGRTTIGTTPSSGMTADYKRGSMFTLPDRATVRGFSAYLDGNGGATSGSQSVRMALYRDSGGVPGGLVVRSPIATVAPGAAGRWVSYTSPATPLDPGNYWIVLHTGATAGVARDFGGGPESNWYGNADAFADGPANPFGTGGLGTGTLSVNVTYTMGY